MIVCRSIYIHVPVERVFALMADPAARSRLHPEARPIRVEIEGGGPLAAGSRCHFRLELGDRIVDYHTRVREFEPNRCIASISDSAVPFEITIETSPENGGTRLTQTEQFEPTVEMLIATEPDNLSRRLLRRLEPLLPWLDMDYARRVRNDQEQVLTRKLEGKLDRWLDAIKRHLETEKANGQD